MLCSASTEIGALSLSRSSSFSQNLTHMLFNSRSPKIPCHHLARRLIVKADRVEYLSNFAFYLIRMVVVATMVLKMHAYLQDYYSILGVSKKASKSDIKSGE